MSNMGQRTWPMLFVLALFVIASAGCVFWFMNEAVRNERLAIRERLHQAHQAELDLARRTFSVAWQEKVKPAEIHLGPGLRFQELVLRGADSAVLFDEAGRVLYPKLILPPVGSTLGTRHEIPSDPEALLTWVAPMKNSEIDDGAPEGRLALPALELLALERSRDIDKAERRVIADRLTKRLNDYATPLPASQRRFLMSRLQELEGVTFLTLPAEQLAAEWLEQTNTPPEVGRLTVSGIAGVWAFRMNDDVTLWRRETIQLMHSEGRPTDSDVSIKLVAPDENLPEGTLGEPAGEAFPGWSFALESPGAQSTATLAEKRVARHLAVGSAAIVVLVLLTIWIGKTVQQAMRRASLRNDLVATVSHELRTPLTAIRALVETLLESNEENPGRTKEYLKLIAEENERLTKLIDQFLTFSRLERGGRQFDLQTLDPRSVAQLAATAFQDRFPGGSSLQTKLDPNAGFVVGDADALVTAIMNLLENAWKNTGEEKQIELSVRSFHNFVRIGVTDNGRGIPRSEQRRIFRRFYQIQPGVGGCGLGLAIVQSIIAAHRGRVHVESSPGRGSSFFIDLPQLKISTI